MRIRACFTAAAVAATAASVAGCGSPYPKAGIDVPDAMLERIAKAVPAREYGLYVLQSDVPQKVEDLAGRTLLACGAVDIDQESRLGLMVSSIDTTGATLFRSIGRHFINPNVGCPSDRPCAQFTSTVTGKSRNFAFTDEDFVYSKDTSSETLRAKCVELMRQDPRTVLLLKRSEMKPDDGVAEIVFR